MAKITLYILRDLLRSAEREGAEVDSPEGARYIRISDTLARELADQLEKVIFDYEKEGSSNG